MWFHAEEVLKEVLCSGHLYFPFLFDLQEHDLLFLFLFSYISCWSIAAVSSYTVVVSD